MTFDQWWHSKYPAQVDEAEFILIREAWEAAALAEREACATVCESLVVGRPDDHAANYFDGGCRTCSGEIRKRSNANVTGLAPAQEKTK